MPAIILCLALLWSCVCNAQTWPTFPQFQFANTALGWVVEKDEIVGHATRVRLFNGQDPFPFCAAWAASILYDQHACSSAGSDCALQPRTAALSLVSASQSSERVAFNAGGSALLALNALVNSTQPVSHEQCNIDDVYQPRNNKGTDLNNLFSHYMNYRNFMRHRGYMMRYYRDEFLRTARQLGMSDRVHTLQILHGKWTTVDELATALLVGERCAMRRDLQTSGARRARVHFMRIHDFNIQLSHDTISEHLAQRRPVLVAVCMNIVVGFQNCFKHATVIVNEGWAHNTITGDRRKVYRVANTWGESWQSVHNDGWMFADLLLEGVYEIITLQEAQ